jgi:exopolysaccharide biosynthesis predicted pyruvyltransferase EpsI
MMKLIGAFDLINTNRLHVGIMAALMGKEVNLYDNNYGKNRDVFQYSLHTFSKVNWCESASNLGASTPETEHSIASAHNGITL